MHDLRSTPRDRTRLLDVLDNELFSYTEFRARAQCKKLIVGRVYVSIS